MFEPRTTLTLNIVTLISAAVFFGYVLLFARTQPAASPLPPPPRASSPQPTPQTITDAPTPSPSATPTPEPTATYTPTATSTPTPTLTIEPPTAVPTPEPATLHTVAPGEFLSTIAPLYGVTVEQLIVANQIENPNQIEVGQVLIIPRSSEP